MPEKLIRINLVSAPSEKLMGKEYSYPLALCYLGSSLEAAGYRVKAHDLFRIPYEQIDAKKLADCDVIGFSILTWNRIASFKLIQDVKRINPNIKIIAGGVHCQTLYGQILKNYPIDLVAIGEADTTIVEMIKILEGRLDKKDVKGIAYLEDEKVIFVPKKLLTRQELDDLPFPKYEYFVNDKSKTVYMMTSRGCGFHCTFCSTTVYWGNLWRSHSVERTINEIEHVLAKFPHIKHIFFHDDQFCLDNNRVIELCKEIVKRDLKFSWNCSARVFPISDEMLGWMKKAGCIWITYGVESGSQSQILSMNKLITIDQIKDTFARTRKAGIKPEMFLFVGIPGETMQTVNETADLLDHLGISLPEVGILEIYPNTKVYEIAKSQGLVDDAYWLSDKPVPIYTFEHSYEELRQMANEIVLRGAKRDKLGFALFVSKHFLKHPLKVIKAGWERKYFQRFLGQKYPKEPNP